MSATIAAPASRVAPGQAAIGLSLAAAIVSAWAVLLGYGLFWHRWTPAGIAVAPILVAVQCWLNVGLFIVAHDCMHGSLAPFRPDVNRTVGRVCLALYGGFSFDRLIGRHFDHHRHSGTEGDPDFHAGGPRRFWPWYVTFFRRYFGWREFAALFCISTALMLAGVALPNLLVLWALPAILSSFQLFYFGTYRPHRHEDDAFTDDHNARSDDFSPLVSLLTCFHFGYHHEHHDQPHLPWWRLPRFRAGQAGRS